MKFTLGWLKEHLETDATLETIVETLTMIGLEVDSVTDRAAGLHPDHHLDLADAVSTLVVLLHQARQFDRAG